MHKNIKRAGIVGGVIGAVVAGGVAFAAFTSTGTFSANGTVGSEAQELTATGTIDSLYPGDCSAVTVTFHNPNAHDATIDLGENYGNVHGILTSLVPSVDGGLPTSLLKINTNTSSSNPTFPVITIPTGIQTLVVAAGHDSAPVKVDNLLCLSKTAGDDWKGASVTLTGTVPFGLAGTEYKG